MPREKVRELPVVNDSGIFGAWQSEEYQKEDCKLRVITQCDGRLFTQPGEFTHSDVPYLAKFNKLTVEPRGTMIAEMINAEQIKNTKLLVFECATMREDGMSERSLKPAVS